MDKFKQGDKIVWRYRHWIGRNWHWIMKTGVFERTIIAKSYRSKNCCYVRFDGNKTFSRVPIQELYPSREIVTLRREVGLER